MGKLYFRKPVRQRDATECQARLRRRLQRYFQQEPQLSAECFAQPIPFDAVGRELQPDEWVDLIGRLEIEMLQDLMQEHARPRAALETGEIFHPSLRLNRHFDWLNGIAIRFFFGAPGGKSGETSDHLGGG